MIQLLINIVNDQIDRAMVEFLHKVAQVMGKKTIAELVENDVLQKVLSEIGVDYAQGCGIAKLVSLEVVLANKTFLLQQM
jgi:EAL domain-containing protein (putative c-di-GMP-specific phosphodiesterase class I)